jgi:hypothetical protein
VVLHVKHFIVTSPQMDRCERTERLRSAMPNK